jgi:hypothetical protein
MIYDTIEPTIPTIVFEEVKNSVASSAYKNSTTEVYYTNNTDKTYNISGTASDKFGLVSVEVTGLSGTNTDTATPEAWQFEGRTLSGNDGERKTITVTAIDKAGNIGTNSIEVEIDNTAPLGIHLPDDMGKDLFFRIGKNDNDEVTPTEERDKEVGGKYANETYSNQQDILIRGRYVDIKSSTGAPGSSVPLRKDTTDDASGLKHLYYYVYNNSDSEYTSTEWDALAAKLDNLGPVYPGATPKTEEEIKAINDFFINDLKIKNQTLKLDVEKTKRVFYTGDATISSINMKGKLMELQSEGSENGKQGQRLQQTSKKNLLDLRKARITLYL